MGVMRINHQVVVFDAAELAPESSFWAGVMGGTVDIDDDWHMVLVDGKPRVGVQFAPRHVAPDWPDGTPQQIHLDLWIDDIDAAHAGVTALGADQADLFRLKTVFFGLSANEILEGDVNLVLLGISM